jgi:hypothetical protein
MIGIRIIRPCLSVPSWSTGIRCESSLASLRKKTGYALNLCKKALEVNQNDLSAAETWLKAEAAKHGWARAAKLQVRHQTQQQKQRETSSSSHSTHLSFRFSFLFVQKAISLTKVTAVTQTDVITITKKRFSDLNQKKKEKLSLN